MSAWFVIAIILAIATLCWFIFAPPIRWTEEVPTGEVNSIGRRIVTIEKHERSTKKYGWLGVILTAVALLLASCAIVGPRNVGVEKFFGATTDKTYDAGFVFKAPWNTITDIDATVQVEEYKGDDCIYVKIADGGSACITLAYRWRINPEGADEVYADYRNSDSDITEAVRKALVSTNIKAAINEVLGKYDPLADIRFADVNSEDIADVSINVVPDYQQINADIKTNVEQKIKDLGDLIEIQSVTVSYVKLPEATQDRINAFNKAVQDTRIAMQDIQTKIAQANANEELAKSLQDPNVLVSKCLDGLISGDIDAPAGFQCWGGTGSSVVIPAAK